MEEADLIVVTQPGTARGPDADADLIEQAKHAPERFTAVFDRQIYAYAARRLGPDLAEDVASETSSSTAPAIRGGPAAAPLVATPTQVATRVLPERRRESVSGKAFRLDDTGRTGRQDVSALRGLQVGDHSFDRRHGYVVVVDDDQDIRELVSMQLERGGYEVATASDGPSAIMLIHRRRPDAVVLDVSMPGMSGVDVCRQLRKINTTATVPIVMLTARTQVNFEAEGRTAGADAYLAKPFSSRVLLSCIEDLLIS